MEYLDQVDGTQRSRNWNTQIGRWMTYTSKSFAGNARFNPFNPNLRLSKEKKKKRIKKRIKETASLKGATLGFCTKLFSHVT